METLVNPMNTTCFKAAKLPCCSGSEVPHLARMHLLAYHGEGSVGAGYLDGAGLGAVFTGHLGSVGAGIHWSSGQCWGRYLLVIWAVLGQVFTGHLGSVGAVFTGHMGSVGLGAVFTGHLCNGGLGAVFNGHLNSVGLWAAFVEEVGSHSVVPCS